MSTGVAEVAPLCRIRIYVMHMKGVQKYLKKKKNQLTSPRRQI